MTECIAKNSKIAVIGRGLAGLSVAVSLARRGFSNIDLVAPKALPGSASEAAVGVVTLKGWNEPRLPLFQAKYLGQKSLPTWLSWLSGMSGLPIRQFWGSVYEPFSSLKDYQWVRSRVYHRDFMGSLAVDVISLPPLPKSWGQIGAFHYWQDGWVNVQDLIAALESVATRYHINFIEERVSRLCPAPKTGWVVEGYDGFKDSFDEVILSAGIFSTDIAKENALPVPDMVGVGGWTVFAPSESDVEFAKITGKMALVQSLGGIRYGSTSENSGPASRQGEYSDPKGSVQTVYLNEYVQKHGYSLAGIKACYGVRARARDRQPIVGPVFFETGQRLWLATGLYKNGMQLAHLIAENLVSQLQGDSASTLFAAFLPSRFLRPD